MRIVADDDYQLLIRTDTGMRRHARRKTRRSKRINGTWEALGVIDRESVRVLWSMGDG